MQNDIVYGVEMIELATINPATGDMAPLQLSSSLAKLSTIGKEALRSDYFFDDRKAFFTIFTLI